MLLSLFLILTFIVTPEVPIKKLLHLKYCGDEKIGGGGGRWLWCVLTFLDGLHHKWVLKNGLYVEVIPVVWVNNWWWHLYSYLFGCVAHVHLISEYLLLQLLMFVRVTVKDILPWSSGVLSSEEGHCIVLVQRPQGS